MLYKDTFFFFTLQMCMKGAGERWHAFFWAIPLRETLIACNSWPLTFIAHVKY